MKWTVIAVLEPDEHGELWPRYKSEELEKAQEMEAAEQATFVKGFGPYDTEDDAIIGAAVAQDFFYAQTAFDAAMSSPGLAVLGDPDEPEATEDNDVVDAYEVEDEDDGDVDVGDYPAEDDLEEGDSAESGWLDDLPF